jgi:2-succinyl-6-hydroxy-2,4-cyclohexadiene-1-carboxylate synthase
VSGSAPGRRELRIPAAGVSLRGIDEGSGEPVLVLHGFTGRSESMEGVAAGLREDFRVLRLDLVGHGESDAPEDPAAYGMERCVEQVEACLDALALPRVHVLGYSMGGRTALALAARRPGRVRSLVMVGASAGIAAPEARTERVRADEALALDIEREGLAAFVERWMALPLFASQARLGPAFLAAAREERLRNDPRGLARSLRGMGGGAQPPLHDALPGLDLPVLLAVGALDEKFRGIADALAARLPRARIATIEEAGHACHLEQPERFLEAARGFLREHGGDRTAAAPAPGAASAAGTRA